MPNNFIFYFCFFVAHVSRDGRDLVILAARSRVLLVRNFERICRGEISLEDAGQVLRLLPRDICFYLAFEHGRICVATVRISTLSPSLRVLMFRLFLFGSSGGFTSSLSIEALPSARLRSCSCIHSATSSLRCNMGSVVCSSPTVAFTLRGKTQDAGTFRCSGTRQMQARWSLRHPEFPWSSHYTNHGWTLCLVSGTSDCAIPWGF